jgi:hypothetical protein
LQARARGHFLRLSVYLYLQTLDPMIDE